MKYTSVATRFSRRRSVPAVALVAAAIVASSSCCLAFNTPPMKASRSTKLYDAYDDQYAQFYNAGSPQKEPEPIQAEQQPEPMQAEQQQQYDTSAAEQPAAPSAYGSYLDNLNGNDAPVVEQNEQVYYEATNSYVPPPPAEPEPLVAEAAFQMPPQQQQQPPIVVPEPMPVSPLAQKPALISDQLKVGTPPALVSKRAPPLQYDSSPTLSARSPTISVTLPVGLRPPKLGKAKDISYGEASRKFRRTVYSHDDWVNHRNPDRFFKYIAAIPTSGIYKSLSREVISVVAVTMVVLIYNGLITGYQDISGVGHPPILSSPFLPPLTLPMTPFTLSSSSLGLLLVFRSNTAYQRWDEARKNWGKNINHTRNLNRMANAYYDRTGISDEQREADLQRLSLCTWAFVRSMKRHLSPEAEDESAFKAELYERLPKAQAQAIIKAAHRPNRALYDLSLAIENLPTHMLRKNEMHTALTIFEDNLGSSERLLTSPVPLIYNRHTSRFLSVWLLLLPFGLWESFGSMWNHIGMLPTMAMLGILLFGIEELATQMEEPFTILPMQAFCDKIGGWCDEMAGWEDGTNGITTNRSYQGRTKVYADAEY